MRGRLFAALAAVLLLAGSVSAAGPGGCASCSSRASCTVVVPPVVVVERTVAVDGMVVSHRSRARWGFTPIRSMILRRAFR